MTPWPAAPESPNPLWLTSPAAPSSPSPRLISPRLQQHTPHSSDAVLWPSARGPIREPIRPRTPALHELPPARAVAGVDIFLPSAQKLTALPPQPLPASALRKLLEASDSPPVQGASCQAVLQDRWACLEAHAQILVEHMDQGVAERKRIGTLEHELQTLQAKHKELRKESKNTKAALKEAQADAKQMRDEKRKLEEQVAELSRRLERG